MRTPTVTASAWRTAFGVVKGYSPTDEIPTQKATELSSIGGETSGNYKSSSLHMPLMSTFSLSVKESKSAIKVHPFLRVFARLGSISDIRNFLLIGADTERLNFEANGAVYSVTVAVTTHYKPKTG